MAGVQWSQTLITLPAAVAAGLVSLLYRYRGKGRPFGSGRTALWALAVIATTGAAATALALGLPEAAAQVPPVTIGLLVPMLLCAGRTLGVESPVERAVWYPVATAGVTILLDHLDQQMCADRDAWCAARVSREWSLEQLEETAWDVHARLSGRTSDRGRLARLRSDFDAVGEAVARSERAGHGREARRTRHAAEQALLTMLGRAYDWGYTDLGTPVRSAASSAAGALSAPHPR